jgi:DNA (cytosine-5)-methyltransferase 1
MIEFKRNSLSTKILSKVSNLSFASKQLKIQKVGKESSKRKLVISTNLLNLFGFQENTQVEESLINDSAPEGMKIKIAQTGSKKVYGRNYSDRERETLMDIRHQTKLDTAFSDASHVHIQFKQGELTITPMFNACSKVIAEGVNFSLEMENGIYKGIIDALNMIKQKAFESVTIDAAPEFIGTQEHTLLCLQLRRLGYTLTQYESGSINARLTGQPFTKTRSVDLSSVQVEAKAVEFDHSSPYSSFVACTGGVDIKCIEGAGFNVSTAFNWTPPESRDFKKKTLKNGDIEVKHNDKTELVALSAAINATQLHALINEDLYTFDYSRVSESIKKANFLHISLQCCDFSSLKDKASRERAIQEMSSTRDMIFPAITLVEKSNIPTVLFENVKNFASSVECALLESRLIALGYKIYKKVMSAKDYNGYSSRSRCYLFASKLDSEFQFPAKEARTVHAWNDIIKGNELELRDVTHTSSVKKGIAGGRIRPFTKKDDISPVLTRSQNRQCKDSLYVNIGEKYFMPSINMLRSLMSIPQSFDLSLFSGEESSNIVGQSICVSMHDRLARSIKSHILGFMDGVVSGGYQATSKVKEAFTPILTIPTKHNQLSLF